jgi:hypothetical protein
MHAYAQLLQHAQAHASWEAPHAVAAAAATLTAASPGVKLAAYVMTVGLSRPVNLVSCDKSRATCTRTRQDKTQKKFVCTTYCKAHRDRVLGMHKFVPCSVQRPLPLR